MSDNYEMTGRVVNVGEMQTFDSGFTKREFVLECAGKYPQEICFEVVKDKCSTLDTIKEDDRVTVKFNIRGREYNGRWYVNLSAWRIDVDNVGDLPVDPPATPPDPDDDPDDLPF